MRYFILFYFSLPQVAWVRCFISHFWKFFFLSLFLLLLLGYWYIYLLSLLGVKILMPKIVESIYANSVILALYFKSYFHIVYRIRNGNNGICNDFQEVGVSSTWPCHLDFFPWLPLIESTKYDYILWAAILSTQ